MSFITTMDKKNYFTTNVNRIYVENNSKMIRTLGEDNKNTKCRKTVETPNLMKKYEDKNVLSTEVLININDQLEISEFRRYFYPIYICLFFYLSIIVISNMLVLYLVFNMF